MPNIVIDEKGVARIIDFNTVVTKDNVFIKNKNSVLQNKQDQLLSPFYPPEYYKTPQEYADRISSHTKSESFYEGAFLQLYRSIHKTTNTESNKETEYNTSKIDSYSLGVIMMECYLLLNMQESPKKDCITEYTKIMKGLTEFNIVNRWTAESAHKELAKLVQSTSPGMVRSRSRS